MAENSVTNNKAIAKNTLFMYLRMIITMIVSLYTSRVILQVLGVEDYGIYQAVGGVVAMIGYLNGALSAGTSRFLTYELGTGNKEKLEKTFSSLFFVHIIFCLFIILFGESLGLWFVNNKLIIPDSRMDAANVAYHLSILTSLFAIVQVPFNASIISHEKMGVYAYASIIDAVLKLAIVFMLKRSPIDQLSFYAVLLALESAGMLAFYWWYSWLKFDECHIKWILDKPIIKSVLSYSGWNVFATTAVALCGQGITIITNMFFVPGVVTARAVANSVNQIANQFVNNFRTAVNPQIVKSYAAGEHEASRKLLLSSTKHSFFLFYLIALPICLCAESLLRLWLGQVPEYSVPYLQLAILTSLFAVFDLSFYTGLYTIGRIKENSLVSSIVFVVGFGVTYLCFKLGASPIISGWILLISQVIIALIIKPIMLVRIVNYNFVEIFKVFKQCFIIVLISAPLPIIVSLYKHDLSSIYYLNDGIVCLIALVSISITIWFVGFDKTTRKRIIQFFIERKAR